MLSLSGRASMFEESASSNFELGPSSPRGVGVGSPPPRTSLICTSGASSALMENPGGVATPSSK
eukprot:6827732-Alexandrium_andersonii.AAC.1